MGFSVQPYYQDDLCIIYHADCRNVEITNFGADLLLTDPPYGISYEHPATKGKWNQIENDDSLIVAEWVVSRSMMFKDAVIFGANYFPELLPHRGRWVCWDKRITEAADKMLGSPFELAWMNKTSGFDVMIRKLHGGVVNADGGKRIHPTQKPSGLFRQIIERVAPEANCVVDPFMGSGSVLLASKLEGKKAIGIEIEEKYCEGAAKRLEQGVLF